ncbi:glycoside hydrolase [Flavobacterium adhaerens]|uniref:glycoside hydrolase n=1 Tax=Flavobacterium adhaerens TaxID=3149043 RepID=UPI0032B626B4
MKKQVFFIIALASVFNGCVAQNKANNLSKKIDAALKQSSEQYQYLATKVQPGEYPKTWHEKDQKLETSDAGWWCSGFYPGTLLYLDEANKNADLKNEALAFLDNLKSEQFNTTTHDLGFMMYCSFGNAERLNPSKEYEAILMQSAKSLCTRYNPIAKCIKSWDSAPWNHASKDEMPVIIDNMMNLELLFWASKHSGDNTYRDIAINHANTTMQNHFRPDYSSYHEIVYDINTGKVTKKITNQGAADESSWARGQAWGLYGYVVMYRETKDKKYLEQAKNIAKYMLSDANMPKDLIPYWDYSAPGIPNALRDSSAASITASALIELSDYVNTSLSKEYMKASETMIENLISDQYLAAVKTNGGFLLKHGVGNMPNKTEIDTPLTYGDYYLVEALLRYKNKK